MTRNDAIECISIALHQHLKPADPIEVAKAAVNIATALDAIGLLTLASATSDSQERSSHEPYDPPPTAEQPQQWYGKRIRT